jgi:hypothetical protein
MTTTLSGLDIRLADLRVNKVREPVFVIEGRGSVSRIPLRGLSMMTGLSERHLIRMSDLEPDRLLHLILRK